ncbi:MAG: hypothetical protein ACJAVW_003412, partial [Spirosomataceae bacterium]
MKLNIRRQTSAPITIGRCQVSTKESLFTLRSPFFIALTLLLTVNGFLLTAQTPDSLKINRLNEVVVKATRATNKTGMAFTNLYKQEIQKQNLGQDIPFLLNQTPSVVVNSDA